MKRGSSYISPPVRRKVFERDNNTCQYCGANKEIQQSKMYVGEHVIPAKIGGSRREYNIVVACGSCNTLKKRQVWIPDNIEVLRAINKRYAQKIIDLAVKDCRGLKIF